MSEARCGHRQLALLKTQLSERDVAIVRQVAELRLMSTRQIETLHFGPGPHASRVTARRTCQRVLRRLVAHRLLLPLERRVGGVRAGSASFVYALGPVGQRLVDLEGPRRRLREPGAAFVDHTLAIGQLVVALTLAAGRGLCELLALEAEPRCWRAFTGTGGQQVLRPDLFVSLGVGEFEHRWFVEVDRGQEHLPTLLRKCRHHEAYYRSGTEQGRHGVAPRVCWLMPSDRQVGRLLSGIERAGDLTTRLFTAGITEQAVEMLCGGTS